MALTSLLKYSTGWVQAAEQTVGTHASVLTEVWERINPQPEEAMKCRAKVTSRWAIFVIFRQKIAVLTLSG